MVGRILLLTLQCTSLLFSQDVLPQREPWLRNPLFVSQDPYVVYSEGEYYYCDSDGDHINVRKSSKLSQLGQQPATVIWTAERRGPNRHANIWAPELHFLNGRWYVYFSADYSGGGRHLLYVLEGGPNPVGSYAPGKTGRPNGELIESTGRWAIDPNVFTGPDQALYLVWSCTDDYIGQPPQSLCLARMSDPLHVSGSTVRIARPNETWETRTAAIEEGPIGFVRNGVTYITYSGSASWTTNDYAVGLLVNESGNLLNPDAWIKKGPILDHHGKTYGPGSVVFVSSPDGTETWSVYHAYDRLACGPWACRSIRMQKVRWQSDGSPLLGYPVDPDVPISVPSGDLASSTGWGDSRSGVHAHGEWRYESSTTLAISSGQNNSPERTETFRGDLNLFTWKVSAQLQQTEWIQPGRQGGKYGIYALYLDRDNNVQALIDTVAGVFSTTARVGGTDQLVHCHKLPATVDLARAHTIAVQKSAAQEFTFYFDDVLIERRSLALQRGQVGVFAETTGARFESFVVTDLSSGWGDAFTEHTDTTNPNEEPGYGDGRVHGIWDIVDSATVRTAGDGTGWHTLYQGNPNRADYTIEVEAKIAGAHTSSSSPQYGLVICFDDEQNHAILWIDPVHKKLVLQSTVRGQTSWDTVSIAESFDATEYHSLKGVKTGTQFVLSLDGVTMLEKDLSLSTGTGGVITHDVIADFRRFCF